MRNIVCLLICCLFFNSHIHSYGWFSVYSDLNVHFSDLCVVNANTVFAIGYKTPIPLQRVIVKTTNAGLSWQTITVPGSYVQLNDISAAGPDTVYASGSTPAFETNLTGKSSNDCVFYKSVDGGYNWSISYIGLTGGTYLAYFLNNTTGFITPYAKIMKTTNGGLNWSSFSVLGMIYSLNFLNINTGYAAVLANYHIFKTIDGGSSWFALANTNAETYSVCFTDTLNGYTCGHDFTAPPSHLVIAKTTDGGYNWNQQVFENITETGKVIQFTDQVTGYVSCFMRILKTTSSGNEWHNNFLSITEILDMQFANSSTGYIACDYGTILKTTNGGEPTKVEKQNESIPMYYYLHQNYPNPFNPYTNIEFEIPKKSNCKILAFNSQGQVFSILNDLELAPGVYKTGFDGSNLPSGIYFYQLIAGDYKETKKMVLLK